MVAVMDEAVQNRFGIGWIAYASSPPLLICGIIAAVRQKFHLSRCSNLPDRPSVSVVRGQNPDRRK